MQNEVLLKVKDLVVHYETHNAVVEAVNNVSFEIKSGQTLGLVGETGAGKTTIALAIMSLLPKYTGHIIQGSIEFDGKDITKLSARQIRSIRGRDISMIFAMSVILETKSLQKYFKTPRGYLHAVENVSLKINKGETLGVVGESGCGKSTLGRTILHLLEPTGGQIFFDGQDITNIKGAKLKALRKQMQIIFQDPFSSLNPRMTVGQIIGEPLRIFHATKSKDEYNSRVSSLVFT